MKEEFNGNVPNHVEGAINIQHDGNGWRDTYYFVHHQKRVLFWPQEFYADIGKPETAFEELHGIREVWHLSKQLLRLAQFRPHEQNRK
jgi:hypothetical protein